MTAKRRPEQIRVVSTTGVHLVPRLSKTTRSVVAGHHNAIRRYLNTGDAKALEPFEGISVAGHELETRTNALDWWGLTGELSYESIYGEVT